jgi:hypothetical protein
MLPKPVVNEENKKKLENWRPITLMGAIDRITFVICELFKESERRKYEQNHFSSTKRFY